VFGGIVIGTLAGSLLVWAFSNSPLSLGRLG
jgi:hypothetical protein